MQNRLDFPGRRSIRTRLLALLLGLSVVAVLVTAYLGVNALWAAGDRVKDTSSTALRAQAIEYVEQLTTSEAQRNELILRGVQRQAESVARYVAQILDHPDVFVPGVSWKHQDWMSEGADGQYANDQRDVCSVFVAAGASRSAELYAQLDAMSYLNHILPTALESDPNMIAIYMGTGRGVTWYYPNVHLGAVLPAGFDVTSRPWYVNAAPTLNPDGKAVWTPVYEDATGQGLLVTVSAPVYTAEGGMVGVVGVDVTLQDLAANVESVRLLGEGYSFLMDSSGAAVALPRRAYGDLFGPEVETPELGLSLGEAAGPFQPVIAQMMAGSRGSTAIQIGDRELFVAYAPLESAGWSLASVVESGYVLQALTVVQQGIEASTRGLLLRRILPFGAGILIVMTVMGWLLADRLIRPLTRLAVATRRIAAGEWDVSLPPGGEDEIGVLASAFHEMVERVQDLLGTLQQRVAERTRGMQAAAEVSRTTTMVLDVEQLLPQVVQVVRDRFDLYYVGLFLLDDTGTYAVLHAGTGEFGRLMLSRGHRLEVGGDSMIGQCMARNEPRVALDVGVEAVRFDNPLLTETRSELALPLRSRGRLVGAMTVQSVQEAAFDEEYVSILQTMADQVAVSIDNARLFAETQSALSELQAVQRRYVTQSWEQYLRMSREVAFRTPLPIGAAEDSGADAEMEQALRAGRTVTRTGGPSREVDGAILATPVYLRGQPVGAVGIYDESGERRWTPEEIGLVEAVVERMSIAADGLRLLDQAQRREAQERTVREITDTIRGAVTVEEAVQRAISVLGNVLGAEVVVQVGLERDAAAGDVNADESALSGGSEHE